MRRPAHILSAMATTAILAVSLCCTRFDTPLFPPHTTPRGMFISSLRTYTDGAAMIISDDTTIAGRVVSSDRAGNFHNTFFIDDGTGAAEIMAGMYDLDATYHPGQRVVVRVRGLAAGFRDGAMQLGLPPEAGSGFATSYFLHPAVIRLHVSAERDVEPVPPMNVTIPALTKDMCGRLVRIAGLTIDPLDTASTWAATDPSPETGYVKFRDAENNSVTVITSGYATFASTSVPRSTVSLSGILLHNPSLGYLLKLRDEADIQN